MIDFSSRADARSRMAYIVGSGPSTAKLELYDFFVPGPVITLNRAILPVRELRLGSRVHAFQKDGCIPHGISGVTPCSGCHDTTRLIAPRSPETALFSAAESSNCYADYSPRVVIDVENDLALPWFWPSAPVAVAYLLSKGYDTITMLCHDGGDATHNAIGRRAANFARDHGVTLIWRLPKRPDLAR